MNAAVAADWPLKLGSKTSALDSPVWKPTIMPRGLQGREDGARHHAREQADADLLARR